MEFIRLPGTSMAADMNAASAVCAGARTRQARPIYIVPPNHSR
jgi:hypothetical protein